MQLWMASVILLWILVLIMALLLAGALRQLGLIQMRLGDDLGPLITDRGLERGALAPDFTLPVASTGRSFTLSSSDGMPRVLTFLSPGCLACLHLIPHLNEVWETRKGEFEFVVVCTGDFEACRALLREYGLRVPMVIDSSGDVESAYEVAVTPLLYFIDHERRVVMRGVANDWRQVELFLDQEGTPQVGRPWKAVDGQLSAQRGRGTE